MNGIPFDVLVQQAVALKRARAAPDRKQFDSWSEWYRHSLHASEVSIGRWIDRCVGMQIDR